MSTLHVPRPPRQGFAVQVGAYIRQARISRQMTPRELASRANLGEDTLSKYQSGTHAPSLRRACALARALALPVDLLLPRLDFANPDDQALYNFFRSIWFEPPAVRALAHRTLKATLELLATPLSAQQGGAGHAASRR